MFKPLLYISIDRVFYIEEYIFLITISSVATGRCCLPTLMTLASGEHVGSDEEMMCAVYASVIEGDACDLVLTLCKYDLRKGDLLVLIWAIVR